MKIKEINLKLPLGILIATVMIFSAGCGKQEATNNDAMYSEENGLGVYENTEYGFKFQYPNKVTVKEDGDIIAVSNWYLYAYENKENDDLENWLTNTFNTDKNKDCKAKSSNIQVKDATAVLFTAPSLEENCLVGGYYFMSPSKESIIRLAAGHDPLFLTEILETLEFIK